MDLIILTMGLAGLWLSGHSFAQRKFLRCGAEAMAGGYFIIAAIGSLTN